MFTNGLAGGPGIAYRLFSLPGPGRTDSVSAGTLIDELSVKTDRLRLGG